MTSIPEPPTTPAYNQPPVPLMPPQPRQVTITFPTIHGKFAAFLYLMTLLCVGLIAWAQVDMALTASDQNRRLQHQQCSGTVYGGEDYTSEERDEYEELCGHPLRTDKK